MQRKLYFSAFFVIASWFSVGIAEEIHRSLPRDLKTLDVHQVQGLPEGTVQRDLFEGLMVEDPAGNYTPAIAESVTVSANGLIYTFRLRRDVKWTNDDPVTAHDFVYSLRRMVDPQTAAEGAFLLESIENASEIIHGTQKDLTQLGIKALDDYTLEIRLIKPTPYFLGILAQPVAMPVHRETVEKYGSTWTNLTNIVSNGPYQLAEICPQSHIKLVKNPKYWDKDQVKVDTVYYWVHQNPETELDKFRTGKLHVTWTIPFTKLSWVRKHMPEALRITPFLALTYYAINMKREPLGQSPTLRQALNMAVNRSALVQKVRGLEEAPAYSWVPTHTANYKAVEADWAKMSQEDRESKARELYQAAGFNDQNPLEIELLCDTDENNRRVATAVASMWQHVLGAKVRVRIEGAKLFFASRAKREFDLIQAHWIGDFNDPETFLSLFRSDIGAQNLTSFDNPRFMETLKLALNEANPDKRQGLMQQVEQIILTELPVILMYFDTQFQLVSPKLQGWQDNILGNHRSKHLSLQK